MAGNLEFAAPSRRVLFRATWTIPLVAAFALGATAAQASGIPLNPNSTACKVLDVLNPPLAKALGCFRQVCPSTNTAVCVI